MSIRRTITTLAAAAVTVASLAVAAPAATADGATWRPCPQEDSRSCVWDADHRGNGQGRSFRSDRYGVAHYISHARAHQLLGR